MRGRALGAFALVALLAGCVSPNTTKTEVRTPGRLAAPAADVCGSYLKLARYWDNNAKKMTIDGKGNSFLTVVPEEKRAEITIGSGPYYALMDLKDFGNDRTGVTSYATGHLTDSVRGWQELLEHAHEAPDSGISCPK